MTLTAKGFAGGPLTDDDFGAISSPTSWCIGDTFAVTQPSTGTRSVAVAIGSSVQHGVRAVNDAAISQALAAPGSGSQWYLIVLRRDWSAKTLTVQALAGPATTDTTALTTIPTTLPATFQNAPGTGQADQPLAWVQVLASTTTLTIFDARMRRVLGQVFAQNRNSLTVHALQAAPTYFPVGLMIPSQGDGITYRWNGSKWCPFTSGWMSWSGYAISGLNVGSGGSIAAEYRWDSGMVLFRSYVLVGSSASFSGDLGQTLPEPVSFQYNSTKSVTPDGRVVVRDPGSGNRLYVGRLTVNGADTASVTCQLDIADGTYLYESPVRAGAPIGVAQSEQIWTEMRYESSNYPLS